MPRRRLADRCERGCGGFGVALGAHARGALALAPLARGIDAVELDVGRRTPG